MIPEPTHLTPDGAIRDGHVPWEMADAVILWGREHGRVCKLVWNPVLRCHDVQMELKPGDPRLEAWQLGKVRQKPVEHVFLHRQAKPGVSWKAIPLDELGVSGIVNYLDRGNMWSGRGKHKNLLAACRAADDHNQQLEDLMMKAAGDNAADNAREHRRQLFDLPLVSVPAKVETSDGNGNP